MRLGDIATGAHPCYKPMTASFVLDAIEAITKGRARQYYCMTSRKKQPNRDGELDDAHIYDVLDSQTSRSSDNRASYHDSKQWEAKIPEALIVTTEPEHPVTLSARKALEGLGMEVRLQAKSAEVDLLTLIASRNLVCSTSTFSWWGAFLAMDGSMAAAPMYGVFGSSACRPNVWGSEVLCRQLGGGRRPSPREQWRADEEEM